ncbi:hypothetical protein K7432_014049 [Basidiobolus ranarum]|uniref:Major facilitator superfamily (MFS) profile domain-containing protein n=1 Tax=Basidiobolus ranarum TaxID=34480 RepID=A0ABR2VQT2_9FUNG
MSADNKNPTLSEKSMAQDVDIINSTSDPENPIAEKVFVLELSSTKRIIAFIGLVLSTMLISLDPSMIMSSMIYIGKDLNDTTNIAWLSIAFLLTNTTFQPVYGKLANLFGRKNIILLAVILYVISLILCGASQSLSMLIGFRALAGLAAGAISSITQVLLADIIPLRDRGYYEGILTTAFAFSSIIGSLIGGVLTDKVSWRWIFYVKIPIAVIIFVILYFCIREPKREETSTAKVLRKIDYGGMTLLAASIICFLLATQWGGTSHPWNSPLIIGLLCGCVVIFMVFVAYEKYIPAEAIIPGKMWKKPNVVYTFISIFFLSMSSFGVGFYSTMFLQIIYGLTSLETSLYSIGKTGSMSLIAIISGIIIAMTGKIRPWVWGGLFLCALGNGLYNTFDETTAAAQVIGIYAITGAGMGMCTRTLLMCAQGSVNLEDMAIVTSMFEFIQPIGATVGIAICGGIFNNRLIPVMKSVLPPGSGNAMAYAGAAQRLPPPVKAKIIGDLVNVFRPLFILGPVFFLIALVASLCIKPIVLPERKPRR